MPDLHIADIDNAKDKVGMMSRLLTETLADKKPAEIVSALVPYLTLDALEDATVAICGVIR